MTPWLVLAIGLAGLSFLAPNSCPTSKTGSRGDR